MIAVALASIVLTLVPYEPSIDCVAMRSPPRLVDLEITDGARIAWNGQRISRATFDSYVSQEREKRPKDRDGFKVFRDAKSEAMAMDIVQELRRNGILSAKNCFGIP